MQGLCCLPLGGVEAVGGRIASGTWWVRGDGGYGDAMERRCRGGGQ
jgi:hypothetical protein